MVMVTGSSGKAWYGEPAVIKGAIASVLGIVIAVLNHNTDVNSAIADAVAVLLPLLSGLWTRQSVTPVSNSAGATGASN